MTQALRTTLIAAAVALLSATVLIVLARPAHAAGSVEVRFVEPERFSDALDVDLAGEQELRRGRDVRILRGAADSPRIHLRWTLELGGGTLKSGEEWLGDLGYLMHRGDLASGDGDLPYEKRLLTQWFRTQFEAAR
jgi:hypothetical protein